MGKPKEGGSKVKQKKHNASVRQSGTMNADAPAEAPNAAEEEDLRAELRNDVPEEDLLNMEIPPMPEPVMSSDGSGQRLLITSIEVENFKSYYGKQVIGPFHHNFTSIIGPNGSGKSNVIDSLLFVFGYRASKLRSAKLSVLIHSSAGHENLPSCSVGVSFQKIIDLPDGGYEVVPGSQFKVSRTAYKDNSSKYFYNGKTMQFKDIAKLLRQVGIDLIHNRFLILQGDVEQIAMMKPKAQSENDDGMLEYLEDIIGSSRLKVPLEKLSTKIEELQEARTAQLTRVKYAEKEKDDAEGPVVALMAELRIDNAIALAKNQLYSIDRLKAAKNLQAQEEAKDALLKEMDEVKKRQKELSDMQDERKKGHEKLQRNYERAQEAFESLKAKIVEVEQGAKKLKVEKVRFEEKMKKLAEDIKKEEKKINDLEHVPETAMAKIEEFRKTLSGIEEVIAEKQAVVDERMAVFEKETTDFQVKKKELEEKLGSLIITEDKACSKLTLAQEALQLLRLEEEKERKKVADLESSISDSKALLETKKKDLVNARKAIPNVEDELRSKKAELANARQEEVECADSVRSLRTKYEQKKQSVEAFRSQNNLLNRLMNEKKSGRIQGIFGRLGDLGAIDQKYDVAISTTCGALDFIVVDTIETAQRCIEFLKRENLGSASFLALDKQEHLRKFMQKPVSTPENVPRLFDLIRVADPTVLPAFYYALRETLVADNITIATRIGLEGRERHRVVTLKGESVEVTGTMCGGGKAEKRGRIGQNVKVDTSRDSIGEMSAMERRLNAEQERLTDIRRNAQQLESRVNALQSDYDRLKRNESNLENDIGPLEQKITGFEKRLREQKEKASSATADAATVDKSKKEVEELTKARNAATDAADEIREQVSEVSEKIQTIYDRVVGEALKELNGMKEKKEVAAKGVSKEQATLNNSQRNLNKAKARKNDFEADLNEAEKALERLKTEESNSVDEVATLSEQKSEAEKNMNEAEAILKEAQTKNVELDGEDVELKKKFNECTRALREQDQVLEDAKNKLIRVQQKVAALCLKYVRVLDRLPEEIRGSVDDDDNLLQKAMEHEHEFFEKLKVGDLSMTATSDVILQVKKLPEYSEEEVEQIDGQEVEFHIKNLEKRKSGNAINMNDLDEYVAKLERYEHEMEILTTISANRDKHRQLYQKLRKQRMTEFMEGFTQIGVSLKEMYQMITLGGNASLDLVDSLDPFSEGVSFSVRPPKKSWKQISNLSGGEKTLSSLALVFALHHYRPTPLYVMDEIDAALDFRNVSIIGHYVKERTKNAQFIIISLRNNMFELADRLVGIYKTFDCTKNVAIDPYAVKKKMILQRSAIENCRQRSRVEEEMDQQAAQSSA